MKIETEMQRLYFAETWQEWFDHRVEGGFWQILHFALKCLVVVFIIEVIGSSLLVSVMEFSVKEWKPICEQVMKS